MILDERRRPFGEFGQCGLLGANLLIGLDPGRSEAVVLQDTEATLPVAGIWIARQVLWFALAL